MPRQKKPLTNKSLDELIAVKDTFDEESRRFIDSLSFVQAEINQINVMKSTSGWKLIDKKARQELRTRILELVKDDKQIQTLLALLTVADTKSMVTTLQEEIDRCLPEA